MGLGLGSGLGAGDGLALDAGPDAERSGVGEGWALGPGVAAVAADRRVAGPVDWGGRDRRSLVFAVDHEAGRSPPGEA